MTLVLVSQPEIPSFAGTMSRGSSNLWSTDRTSWADAEIQGFHGLQKNSMIMYIHFKGPHYICTNIMIHTFGLIVWIFSNYSLSKFIFIFYAPWYRLYAVKWLPGPANRQSLGDLTVNLPSPFQTLGGNSGLDPGIYNHFWIHRIHLCIKYSITI